MARPSVHERTTTLGQFTQIQTGDQFNLNKLNIGQINICSLRNKMDEVKIMLETNQFDISAVCETHLSNKIGNRQLQVDGYRSIRRDRPNGRRGGGGVEWWFEDIVIPLEKAWYKYKNLVLVGDFNVNFSKTAHGHDLRLQEKRMSALVQLDCSVINKDFTRVTPTTETMIDLIITKKVDLVENIKTTDTGISDHNLVSFSTDFKPRKVPPRIVTIRNCKKMEIEKVKLDLQNAPWSTCEMFEDVEDKYSVWTDIFKDICGEHAPKRKVKLRRQTLPWMSGALRHKMNRRYKALQKAKKERNNEGLWKEYRKLRNEVTAELRRAKSTYFAELANGKKINTRKYWKILNQASGKESNMKTIRAIKSDTGALVTNDREIANILNKHFATTGEKLAGLLNNRYTCQQ